MTTINAVQVYLPEDCITHACDCERGECMFDRCPDCDRLVNGHGMTAQYYTSRTQRAEGVI